jgi:hypothetical protein
MSYCAYENTLKDLEDCFKQLKQESLKDIKEMDDNEKKSRTDLIKLCKVIGRNF